MGSDTKTPPRDGRRLRRFWGLRRVGPLLRFDPHPPPVREHGARGPYAWYGAFLFDTAVCERFNRGAAVVDVCPTLRATLVGTTADTAVLDLTDEQVCATLGAAPELGEVRDETVYDLTQRWARHLHRVPGVRGLRYWSARQRGPDDRRHGANVVLWRKRALARPAHQHRLIDDALWPHVLVALDRAGVAVNRVGACPRC